MKRAVLLFLLLVLPLIAGIFLLFFSSNTLIYQNYHDMYMDYLIDISLGVEFLVAVYFVYTRCYKDKCVGVKAYLKGGAKSSKDEGVGTKLFFYFFLLPIITAMPFIIAFMYAWLLSISYVHIYTYFVHEKVSEHLLMQYGTASNKSSKYAVAKPNDTYKLAGHLGAIGFGLNDKNNTPYILNKKEINGTSSYVVELGYVYQVWAKKNKYGYFIDDGDYIRVRKLEYTKQELYQKGCTLKKWKWNCEEMN